MNKWRVKEVQDVKFIDLKTGEEIIYLDSLSLSDSDSVYSSGGHASNKIKPLVKISLIEIIMKELNHVKCVKK